MQTTPFGRRTITNLYHWAVILAGAALLLLFRPAWSKEPAVLLTLILMFTAAEYFPTRVRMGAISFSFPLAYTAFLLYGVSGAAFVAAVGTLLANLAQRRSWRVIFFNSTQFALAAFIAGFLSLRWAGPPTTNAYILPVSLYLFLYYIVNNVLVDLILWLRLKRYRFADWLAKSRYESLSAVVSLSYCILMMLLAPQQRGHDPLALIFFFIPLLSVGTFIRLVTNLSQFARQMETLIEVSTLTTYTPNEAEVLDAALAHLGSFVDYRYTAVYEVEGEELAVRAIRGVPSEEFTLRRIPMGVGVTGSAAQSQTSVFSYDARQDARNSLAEGAREGAHMIAAFPLVSGGQVLGVLTVGKERSHSIPPEDVRLLTIYANLLAAILRNLNLVEERERLVLLNERNRFAREIHDGLAQSLAGAVFQMDRLERLLETDVRGARSLLQYLRGYLRECLLEVRRSIFNLRPTPNSVGLLERLNLEVERLRNKGPSSGTEIRFEVRGEQRRLSILVEDEMFRIVQEAITNALKHANATEITVSVHFFADRLQVSIRDKGRGFLLADAIRQTRESGGFGLTGMSERAERLGASFDVDSRLGIGTRLTVEVPLMGE
jgi:signal transduction histidine kinase